VTIKWVTHFNDGDSVCDEESGGPKERPITYSGPLRSEYCILFIQHNTAI